MPTNRSKRCCFCGRCEAVIVSAWPDWATRLIASEMAVRTGSRLVSKVRDRILNHFPQWDLSDEFVATRKLQIACKRCHQGWMSRIDAMAKPMALPLIKGETAIIGPSSQAALAAWAAKTVMIAELTSTSGPVTPECERMELRQKQRPPQSWNIWAAFSNGVECEASYVRHTARLSAMQSAELRSV